MLNYTISGSYNRHIFFIHGNSQNVNIWNDVINNPVLGEYTSICIDLPGHGHSFRSNDPANDYSFTGIARHLAEVINSFNLDSYIVVATSIGTNFFAETLPFLKNCKGAFLIGCCILGDNLLPADLLASNPNAAANFMPEPSAEQLELFLRETLINKTDDETIQTWMQSFRDTDKEFRKTITNCIVGEKWSDEIKNLRDTNLLTALVYGAEERILNKDYLNETPLNKWRGDAMVVENAGHSVQLDQPVVIASLISEFAHDAFK